MTRPKLLDLFCGAGGCSVGYDRAGFEVVGVDIEPQPNYPFDFIQADAMEYPLDGFDVVHASPPCQRYSAINRGLGNHEAKPDLLPKTRELLISSGADWVLENVIGAPMGGFVLCGSMFGLESTAGWLRRHRWFETSRLILGVPHCQHDKTRPSVGVYGNGTNSWHRAKLGRNVRVDELRDAMGIDWTTRHELTQAIPPAYTEFIGRQLLRGQV